MRTREWRPCSCGCKASNRHRAAVPPTRRPPAPPSSSVRLLPCSESGGNGVEGEEEAGRQRNEQCRMCEGIPQLHMLWNIEVVVLWWWSERSGGGCSPHPPWAPVPPPRRGPAPPSSSQGVQPREGAPSGPLGRCAPYPPWTCPWLLLPSGEFRPRRRGARKGGPSAPRSRGPSAPPPAGAG